MMKKNSKKRLDYNLLSNINMYCIYVINDIKISFLLLLYGSFSI